jgi:hypothetical protein
MQSSSEIHILINQAKIQNGILALIDFIIPANTITPMTIAARRMIPSKRKKPKIILASWA